MSCRKAPKSYTTPSGATIFVGRDAIQNDELVLQFKEKNPHALWFHIQDQPGPHVILDGSTKPEDIRAAAIFAARNKTCVVEYCEVSNVYKPKKASPGEVMLMEEPQRISID